jgi:hypothetical protein
MRLFFGFPTSSARASSGSGTLRPSALAVPRLMTSSNRVARSTGTSAGQDSTYRCSAACASD